MLNLEKYEKGLIAFLVLALLLGLGFSVYKKSHPGVDIRIAGYSSGSGQDIGELPSFKININEASEADLAKLKGVGRVLAGRIVKYRESRGPFGSIDDIRKVKGVGKALYERIKDNISLE